MYPEKDGSVGRARTYDRLVNSQQLYLLSYDRIIGRQLHSTVNYSLLYTDMLIGESFYAEDPSLGSNPRAIRTCSRPFAPGGASYISLPGFLNYKPRSSRGLDALRISRRRMF